MKYFINEKFSAGLLLTGINTKSAEGKLIRSGVHSVTNHDGMTVTSGKLQGIAEAVPPRSRITTLAEYEDLMNNKGYIVRLYRPTMLTQAEQKAAADAFTKCFIGARYPEKWKMTLLAMPIYNLFLDKTKHMPSMRLTWCSQLVKESYEIAKRGCLLRYDGHDKQLFTPRTFENRILQGLFLDVTDEIIGDTEKK